MSQATLFRSRAAAEKFAKETVGGMTQTSKMPSYSYSTSAFDCNVGGKLANVAGSVCSGCYARKNRYLFSATQNALRRRSDIIGADLDTWRENITTFLRGVAPFVPETDRFFRWHDSGDIRSAEHLLAIVQIAREVPEWHFWLPTKEYAIVRAFYRDGGVLPANLAIRVSHPMVNARGSALGLGCASGVVDAAHVAIAADSPNASVCPAPQQGNTCGNCRACWDSAIVDVFYHAH